MYIITAKFKSKETGRIMEYAFLDEATGNTQRLSVQQARDKCAYVRNAMLSNQYYRKKSGYPDIPVIELSYKKKKNSKRKKKENNKDEVIKQLKKVNRAGDDGYTNMHTKRQSPNSNPVPPSIPQHDLKNITNWKKILGAEYIDTCMTIRTAARAGRLSIDTTKHMANNGWNVQLFGIIKASGLGIRQFIRQYLSVLQPYALEEFDDGTEKPDGHVWMVDTGYHVGIVIKVDKYNKEEPLIISFHESNVDGSLIEDNKFYIDDNALCAVIPENVEEINIKGQHAVKYIAYIQHGFIRARIIRNTNLYGNGAVVIKYKDIRREYDMYIKDTYKCLERGNKTIKAGTAIIEGDKDNRVNGINEARYEDFSFPSFGHMDINSLYFLEDALNITNRQDERTAIKYAGTEIMSKMSEKRIEEAKKAVKRRESSVKSGGVLGELFKDNKK